MNQVLATATILEQPLPLPHIGMCQDGTSKGSTCSGTALTDGGTAVEQTKLR